MSDIKIIIEYRNFQELLKNCNLSFHIANGLIYILKPSEVALNNALYETDELNKLNLFLKGYLQRLYEERKENNCKKT